MVYLLTKLGHLWGFYVGKYTSTSTMDDLGGDHVFCFAFFFNIGALGTEISPQSQVAFQPSSRQGRPAGRLVPQH